MIPKPDTWMRPPLELRSSGKSGQHHHEPYLLTSCFLDKVERAATGSTVRQTFLNCLGEALHLRDFLHIRRTKPPRPRRETAARSIPTSRAGTEQSVGI